MIRGLCQFWGHELKGDLSAVLSRGTSDEKKEKAESKGQYFLKIFAFVLKCLHLSILANFDQTAELVCGPFQICQDLGANLKRIVLCMPKN